MSLKYLADGSSKAIWRTRGDPVKLVVVLIALLNDVQWTTAEQ